MKISITPNLYTNKMPEDIKDVPPPSYMAMRLITGGKHQCFSAELSSVLVPLVGTYNARWFDATMVSSSRFTYHGAPSRQGSYNCVMLPLSIFLSTWKVWSSVCFMNIALVFFRKGRSRCDYRFSCSREKYEHLWFASWKHWVCVTGIFLCLVENFPHI